MNLELVLLIIPASSERYSCLFLFTGTHADYHKPSDDSDKINFDGVKPSPNYVLALRMKFLKNLKFRLQN